MIAATAVNIEIADIDSELSRLSEIQKEKNQITASLFTLIIYAHEEDRIRQLREIVQSIIEKFPCRIIFIAANRNKESNYLRAGVSNIVSEAGETLIACHQINIDVGFKQLHRVPFLILPHLIPDLPVHLLWGEDPTSDHEILPKLQKIATRLIINSDCSTDYKQFSQKILDSLGKLRLEIMDINWALISGWRDILFQTFSSSEHLLQLRKSKTILISYNCLENKLSVQAIYLLAWLAAQLEWTFQSASRSDNLQKFVFDDAHHRIEFHLLPQKIPNLAPGSIFSVDINTQDDWHYLISRLPTQSKVVLHISSKEICELPFTLALPDPKRGLTFMKEIFYHKISEHYRHMLEVLTRFPDKINECKST
jgi:glucose-6-phosphate dehydrogenase assembly protein OpcA